MEIGIASRRNCTSTAGLLGFRRRPGNQTVHLLQQIVGERHYHFQDSSRATACSETLLSLQYEKDPSTKGRAFRPTTTRLFSLPRLGSGFVGQEDSEIDGPIAVPILGDIVANVNCVGCHLLDDFREGLIEFRFAGEGEGQGQQNGLIRSWRYPTSSLARRRRPRMEAMQYATPARCMPVSPTNSGTWSGTMEPLNFT